MSDLRDAVEEACRAERAADFDVMQEMVVTEFVVVASAAGFDDDGEPVSQVVVIPEGGSEHRVLGLIEHARLRMHAEVLEGYQ